jgi:predicted nucleic acid-binding protein
LVIADTGPFNYLIQIGHVDLPLRMFERVALPSAVQAELSNSRPPLPGVPGVDEGESAAIALAEFLHADQLLIDEREGSRVARGKGLRVTGGSPLR